MKQFDDKMAGIVNAFIDPDSIELDEIKRSVAGDNQGTYLGRVVLRITLTSGLEITFLDESARRLLDRMDSESQRERRKRDL